MKYLALGQRIKAIREQKRMTLAELSKRTGFAEDKLRMIEENAEQPIIAGLIRLSKGLGVNVADIFRDRPVGSSFEVVKKSQRQKVRPLLQPSDAKVFDYTYELLTTPADSKHLDAYLLEFAPHQGKSPTEDVTHEGEEFIYILEGEIKGEIDGKAIHLEAGDSLYFRSTSPHIFYNPGTETARAIAVLYPF